ncbi:PTS sugar transporter subunit IIA [bacterium]|nr:MAG: PTS sugar transporter subunit IIA [bacterium]
MKISQLLTENCVSVKLQVSQKAEAIDSLINLLSDSVSADLLEQIRIAVKERESIMSTGVGKGLAIPHAKVSGLEKNLAAFAILENAVEYESIDHQPVKMIFLMVGPTTQNSEHIKLLSRISRLMNNELFREKLIACDSEASLVQAFTDEENQYFPH